MQLIDYSMLLFGTTALLYITAYAALFHNPSIAKFIIMACAWVINTVAFVWYGIATQQLGFILIVALEFLFIFFVYIITGKVIKDDYR